MPILWLKILITRLNLWLKITKITDDPKYDCRIGQIQLQNSKFEQAIEYFNIARKKAGIKILVL